MMMDIKNDFDKAVKFLHNKLIILGASIYILIYVAL